MAACGQNDGGLSAGTSDRIDSCVRVGGYAAAADPAHIRAHGITHIVKLFRDDPSYPGGCHRHLGVQYHIIPAEDHPAFDLRGYLAPAMDFIASALRSGGVVLIHCHCGVSRAPTVAIVHRIVHAGDSLRNAWQLVKSRRRMAQPNPGFVRLLVDVERRISAHRRA